MATPTTAEYQQSERERQERRALDQLAERLAGQFPEVPVEQIVAVIEGRYAEFDGSRIRDFVPVLVEQSVKRELSSRS